MKKLLVIFLILSVLFIISSCYYSKSDLSKIVDEKLESHLLTLWSYFEQEDTYTFDEAKQAFDTVYDVIYHEFY